MDHVVSCAYWIVHIEFSNFRSDLSTFCLSPCCCREALASVVVRRSLRHATQFRFGKRVREHCKLYCTIWTACKSDKGPPKRIAELCGFMYSAARHFPYQGMVPPLHPSELLHLRTKEIEHQPNDAEKKTAERAPATHDRIA